MTRLARARFDSLAKVHLTTCEPCLVGKATRKPFSKVKRASFFLELVHLNFYGPVNVMARNGAYNFTH